MSCITALLKLKGDKPFLQANKHIVIEGGGTYKNHEYLITFTDLGHRCGYVALLPHESPDEDSIVCHGGITFYENAKHIKAILGEPVCPDIWIGFDAAHGNDEWCLETVEKYFGEFSRRRFYKDDPIKSQLGCEHRTYAYMEQECKNIIDQLVG